jgi:hypothetical protein
MPYSTSLAIVAGLAVVGAAAGIGLGRATVGEIDPAYRTDPETRFHGDLAANRGPDWAQVQAREYAASAEPVITQCDGCTRPYPVAFVAGHDPYVDLAVQSVPAAAPRVRMVRAEAEAVPQVVVVQAPAPDPVRTRLARYASYAVSQEEAAARQAAAQADPGEDEAATQ